ncbi:MAG: type II toxin-antitoxin system Phd/YefM family antitoxin [Patescibacteria group bacterium]
MEKTLTTSAFRDNIADAIRLVNEKEKYFVITNKGKAVSALINLDYFEDLLALSSPEFLADIRAARLEAKQGKLHSHEEVFG